ncbi:MAG: VacJ family lipoprotein [Candidatus Sumerlaeota bacterium]|nr:VacJ family lipoprotein [Candidatus Sumerlaeota bacterium]
MRNSRRAVSLALAFASWSLVLPAADGGASVRLHARDASVRFVTLTPGPPPEQTSAPKDKKKKTGKKAPQPAPAEEAAETRGQPASRETTGEKGGEGVTGEKASEAAAQTEDLLREYEEKEAAPEHKPISDPLRPWNTIWFHFNDKMFFWFLKPVAKGYGFLLPRPTRVGIWNFTNNLGVLVRSLNCAFQGKCAASGKEFGRFLVDSTMGVLGFWNPSVSVFHWKEHREDFDQTLAVWHVGTGCYLTWPFLGPSSVRGTFGVILDIALDPLMYLPGVSLFEQINDESLGLNPYESVRSMAVKPYVAVRDAYVQNRQEEIAK